MNVAITFVTHTNKPGGAELALRRYLTSTRLPTRVVTLQGEGVWTDLPVEVVPVSGPLELRRELAAQPGVVVANSMRAALFSALSLPRSRTLVYWVRDGLTESAMSPLALFLTTHVTSRRVDHFVANSRWTAGTITAALGRTEEDISVAYSPSGVAADTLPDPRGRPIHPLKLLYLGRISPWKGPDVAVRALGVLHERGVGATLTIAGAAHFGEEAYADRLARLSLEVEGVQLHGHVHDVPSLLREHDLLVHCSVRPEPFGQVIVQALAHGLPVVSSGVGGPAEILQDCPVDPTYEPDDPEALADAVRVVLGDYERMSRWGLERARLFTDRAAVAVADQIFDQWM